MGGLSHTVSGNITSFRTPSRVPIESLKIHFLPKQEGSGDPSPQNIRNIVGWTGCNLNKAKKNIIKPYFTKATTVRGLTITPITNGLRVQGKATAEYAVRLSSQEVRFLEAGKKYAFSLYINGDISGCRDPYLGYNTGAGYRSIYNLDQSNNYSFIWTVPDLYANASAPWFDMYIRVLEGSTVDFEIGLQMEVGENATTYEPYSGETIPLSWSDHGVEYDGYIDPVRGKLVAEWEAINKPLSQWTHSAPTSIRYYTDFEHDMKCVDNGVYGNAQKCNIAPFSWSDTDNTNPHFFVGRSSSKGRAYLYLPADYDGSRVIQVAAKLVTPIEYDIDPITLQSFLDYNNFWSDANDVTEVTYAVTESKDILATRKKAIAFDQGKRRKVRWNQLVPEMNSSGWGIYTTDALNGTISNGLADMTFVTDGSYSRYRASIYSGNIDWVVDHYYYASYMVKPTYNGKFGIEYARGRQISGMKTVNANEWGRARTRTMARSTGYSSVYIPFPEPPGAINDGFQIKSPIVIDLTLMFGEGNEPTQTEFEKICAINGIDLTVYHPIDTGSDRWLIIP